MKLLLTVTALLMVMSGTAFCQESVLLVSVSEGLYQPKDPIEAITFRTPAPSTRGQELMVGMGLMGAFAAIDYSQSVEMFFHRKGYHELNPVLGRHPSRVSMLSYGIAALAMLYVGTTQLPEPWGRILLDSAISSEAWNIEDNQRIMEGLPRRINAIPIILTFRW